DRAGAVVRELDAVRLEPLQQGLDVLLLELQLLNDLVQLRHVDAAVLLTVLHQYCNRIVRHRHSDTRRFVAFNPLTQEPTFWFQRIFTSLVHHPHPEPEPWPRVPARRRCPPGRSSRSQPGLRPPVAPGRGDPRGDRGRRPVPHLAPVAPVAGSPGGAVRSARCGGCSYRSSSSESCSSSSCCSSSSGGTRTARSCGRSSRSCPGSGSCGASSRASAPRRSSAR